MGKRPFFLIITDVHLLTFFNICLIMLKVFVRHEIVLYMQS